MPVQEAVLVERALVEPAGQLLRRHRGAAGLAGEIVPAPAAVRPQLAREHDGLVPEQLRGLAEVGLRGGLLLGGAPARVLLLDKLDALVDVDPVLVVLVLRPVRLPGLPVDWATVASATALKENGWGNRR